MLLVVLVLVTFIVLRVIFTTGLVILFTGLCPS